MHENINDKSVYALNDTLHINGNHQLLASITQTVSRPPYCDVTDVILLLTNVEYVATMPVTLFALSIKTINYVNMWLYDFVYICMYIWVSILFHLPVHPSICYFFPYLFFSYSLSLFSLINFYYLFLYNCLSQYQILFITISNAR